LQLFFFFLEVCWSILQMGLAFIVWMGSQQNILYMNYEGCVYIYILMYNFYQAYVQTP